MDLPRSVALLDAPVAPETAHGQAVADRHHRSQVATVYGGTVEVFRSMLAEQIGLPRPQYGTRR